MKKITYGIIGSGFIAEYHVRAARRVYGLEIDVKSVAGQGRTQAGFADRHGIRTVAGDYHDILDDPEIDVVDICTPPDLHARMIGEALRAGKHVICEKPLTGYFRVDGDRPDIGSYVDKTTMYGAVSDELDQLRAQVDRSGRLFMYAENWVYFPSVQKAAEILAKRESTILMIHGQGSHNGSHAAHAAWWRQTGGGCLIRNGCHPLSAALYLKRHEGRVHGRDIRVESVVADMGNVARILTEAERRYIDANPVDVEDLGTAILTFSDGTKAVITSGDMVVGGSREQLELYTNDALIQCNASPHNGMIGYFAGDKALSDIYMIEKIQDKTGWQNIMANEESERGYNAEMQDFMECVAHGRQPQADFDLACSAMKAVYAAYAAAETGRRFQL